MGNDQAALRGVKMPIKIENLPSIRDQRTLLHSISVTRDSAQDQTGGHRIVVVTEGTRDSGNQADEALQKLADIPTFSHLLRNGENDLLERMDGQALQMLCHRYQDHLRQCSEAVTFDQNSLCVRLKEVDFAIQTLYSSLGERQRMLTKYAEQLRKVKDMQTSLDKVKNNIDQLVPLLEKLNNMLPVEHRFEQFSMTSKCENQ